MIRERIRLWVDEGLQVYPDMLIRRITDMTIEDARARALAMTQEEVREVCILPSDFGWQDPADEEEGTSWALGPLVDSRDADALLQANGQTMVATMTELFGSEGIDSGWQVIRYPLGIGLG